MKTIVFCPRLCLERNIPMDNRELKKSILYETRIDRDIDINEGEMLSDLERKPSSPSMEGGKETMEKETMEGVGEETKEETKEETMEMKKDMKKEKEKETIDKEKEKDIQHVINEDPSLEIHKLERDVSIRSMVKYLSAEKHYFPFLEHSSSESSTGPSDENFNILSIHPTTLNTSRGYSRSMVSIKSTIPILKYQEDMLRPNRVGVYRISDIDWTQYHPIRSGVIPYTFNTSDKKIRLCLGLDDANKEWSDFGGGVNSKENSVNGGLRELHEESMNIFHDIPSPCVNNISLYPIKLSDYIFVMSKDIMIILHPVYETPESYVDIFEKKIENMKPVEVSEIRWFTSTEFYQLSSRKFSHGTLYNRVRKLFYSIVLDQLYATLYKIYQNIK